MTDFQALSGRWLLLSPPSGHAPIRTLITGSASARIIRIPRDKMLGCAVASGATIGAWRGGDGHGFSEDERADGR
jgi:hypothetical protein